MSKKADCPPFTGVVIYSDGGSAGSNPGPIGSAIHAYFYRFNPNHFQNKVPKHIATPLGYIERKTDTQLKAYPKEITDEWIQKQLNKAQVEVEIIAYLDQYRSTQNPEQRTNNAAEAAAFLMALITVLKHPVDHSFINTDSQYVIRNWHNLEKIHADHYLRKDNTPLPNEHLWRAIYEVYQDLKSANKLPKVDWVKGHSGNIGNETADFFAGLSAQISASHLYDIQEERIQSFTTDGEALDGYWKAEAEPHPLLQFTKRFYWNPLHDQADGLYYLGNLGKGQENYLLGKRVSDSGYAVVRLLQNDPVLESIKQYQNEALQKSPSGELLDCVVAGNLDTITSSKTYNRLLKLGHDYVSAPSRFRSDLTAHKAGALTEVLSPPYMAMEALESIVELEVYLKDYLSGKPHGTPTDLTDLLYDRNHKTDKQTKEKVMTGLTLKKEIDSALTEIKVKANYEVSSLKGTVDLTLTLGLDLPRRNALKRLEVHQPKVTVFTFERGQGLLRYYTVVELDTGECGIWAASHANTVFLDQPK